MMDTKPEIVDCKYSVENHQSQELLDYTVMRSFVAEVLQVCVVMSQIQKYNDCVLPKLLHLLKSSIREIQILFCTGVQNHINFNSCTEKLFYTRQTIRKSVE